jgi:hypothetical protein
MLPPFGRCQFGGLALIFDVVHPLLNRRKIACLRSRHNLGGHGIQIDGADRVNRPRGIPRRPRRKRDLVAKANLAIDAIFLSRFRDVLADAPGEPVEYYISTTSYILLLGLTNFQSRPTVCLVVGRKLE